MNRLAQQGEATGWRHWLREHRLLLWAVVFSPCHLFWALPLAGLMLAATPFDSLFRQARLPLEVTLAVLLSIHSIVVIALWALRPSRRRTEAMTEQPAPGRAPAAPPATR